MAYLVVINTTTRTCRRYSGRTITHEFEIMSWIPLDSKLVEQIRTQPDTLGEPHEPEAA